MSYALAFVIALGTVAAVLLAERESNARFAAATRVAASDQLWLVRSRLEQNLYGNIQLVKGLVSVIAHNPRLGQAEFARAAQPLFESRSQLRNIGAAPDMVIRYMYPLEGNEKAIGLDYRRVPAQLETAERARRTGELVLAGPVNLVQGGGGFVARIPLHLDRPDGRREFWGLLSAVIDADRLYRDSGLENADLNIEIAIRGKDGLGTAGEVFHGRAGVFDANPVTADLVLPNGSWQLAAVPRGGWPASADNVWTLRLTIVGLGLVLTTVFLALGRALRLADRALRQAQSDRQRLASTLENTPHVAVQWFDREGRIVFWNQASETMFGWRKAEAVGRRLDELGFTPDETARFLDTLRVIEREGRTVGPREIVSPHRTGARRAINATLFAVAGAEQPLFAFMGVDVTERKAAEAALVGARNDAQAASRAKSEFLASMSHELRTPMNAVLGFAQILEVDEGVSAENRKLATGIVKAGRHLLHLINEVLDLERIESGRMEIRLERVDVDALIAECLAMTEPLADERRITVDWVLSEGAEIHADRLRAKQALINLLSNAIKYNREGGRVDVGCRTIRPGWLEIRVGDTGRGIAPELLASLFQPFNRLGAEGSNIEGTGIGLVITRRVVEMMGGHVDVGSQLGVGSTFRIELPLAGEQADAVPAGARPGA